MEQFVQLAMTALAAGCIYAVIALSFELAYESTGVVNFATGQLVTIGALVGASSVALAQLNMAGAYLLTMAVMCGVALLFLVGVHLPLRRQPALTIVIGTIGAGILIQNVALLIWGPLPRSTRSPLGADSITILGANVPLHVIYVIALTFVLILGLYLLLYRSSLGNQFRALAQDPEVARLMGIRVTRLYALTWVLVCVLAGIAGLLVGPMWFIDVSTGEHLGLKAFAAAIIGGFGSIPGAIIGGIVVGFAEIFSAKYISSTYKDAIVFVLMFLFLLIRPQGLFGERIADRG